MFQDRCLSCGAEVEDGRAYCNELCHSGDLTSPSISSASSPFASPHLHPNTHHHPNDVPALVPSALGRALRAYTRDRYSASSSSSSWSVVTDDDDDDCSEYDQEPHVQHSAGLSYARRPSGTNNRSTFPALHRRTSSASSSVSLCLPQSAPGGTSSFHHLDDDDGYTDSFAPSDLASDDPARPTGDTIAAGPAKARRKHNRASLPAYFSILSTASAPSRTTTALPPIQPGYPFPTAASPLSSSSGHSNTLTRTSPPTPKVSLLSGLAHTAHLASRGRRHAHAPRTRSGSRSRSPSPARRRDSEEKVADWSDALAVTRGRPVRRNSSPSAKMLSPDGRSESGSRRGRVRVDELSPERPRRSGLLGRARRGGGDEWDGLGAGWW
ncbi:hypothetical protein DFH07DRAFT_19860 [Mycena maculata]|uniref:Uncharacterized protein n=1 Tax=Mycena maculata TaxID=230809 RepID=A0AAD7IK33_9AGAR|nr:hypothetical protein DFH07DRAFT_19860 [Mycena maculata]